jgi:enoyl-CoA hydratase
MPSRPRSTTPARTRACSSCTPPPPGIFAAGADIAELRDRDADAALLGINANLFEKLEAHRWPTIAAIDGAALGGGCELALACDLRIASDRAFFGQPELALGIMAGAGGNWRLAQAAGQQVARRMLYAGARLSAAEALDAGLVDELAADPAEAARTLAGAITRQSWRALELTKLALRSHRPATTTFDVAAQALLFTSQDKYDRMTAFLERRGRKG